MKILIISYYFPPLNAIASLRPYSWAKYWAEAGHDVTVLTTTKENTAIDLKLPVEGFKIIEADFQNIRKPIYKNKDTSDVIIKKKKKNWIKKLILRYCNHTGALLNASRYPSIFMLWKKPAVKAILNKNECYDIAVATHSPFVTFLIALELKKYGIVNKCVLDYRDLWTDNHVHLGIPIFSCYEKKMENKLCHLANRITVVSEPLANILRAKYGNDKVHVSLNGFDPNDLLTLPQKPYFKNDKINIIYAGSIYLGHRDPTPLFEALKKLSNQSFCLDRLNVCFFGSTSYLLDGIIKKYELEEIVCCCENLSREDSLWIQRDADVLLFLEDNLAQTDGILTGKLFEYMFSGTPIWAIGKKWQPSRMIEKYRLGKAFGNDANMINVELQSLVQEGVLMKINPKENRDLQVYTREYQANKMLEILQDVIIK